MNILNLYAGVGGNRKLWKGHSVTAIENREDIAGVYQYYFPDDTVIVTDAHRYLLEHYNEYDFIWSSPPCQTHSLARFNNTKAVPKYPDMKLYQEIIFLKEYFRKGLWVVENVRPYYDMLMKNNVELGRHIFWSNFRITKTKEQEIDIQNSLRSDWAKLYGFDLSQFRMQSRTDQIYRNCVHPSIGLHILNCAEGKAAHRKKQGTLFE